jgi:hypothetical protein
MLIIIIILLLLLLIIIIIFIIIITIIIIIIVIIISSVPRTCEHACAVANVITTMMVADIVNLLLGSRF